MSQPGDDVAGLSVASKDATGWHVQQTQEQGTAIISIRAESITETHMTASYLFVEAPAGNIDFGSGPRETVRLLIYATNMTTDNDIVPLVIAGSVTIIAAIIMIVIVLSRRDKVRHSL
jgi:hypothetical protein